MGILDQPMLEYVYKDTLMHKMHPIPKAFMLVVITLLAQFYFDPVFILPILIFVIILAKPVSKIPNTWLLPMYVFGTMSILERSYNALFISSGGYYRVYSSQLMTTTLIYLANIPVLGVAKVTWGGLFWLLSMVLKFFVGLFAVAIFLYTTDPSDLMQYLASKKVSKNVLFIVFAGFNFFPILLRYARTIMNAQQLRGVGLSKNPVKAVNTLAQVFHPLVIRVTVLADILTLSASIRGFGSGQYSYLREIKLSNIDMLITVFSIAFFVFMVAGLALLNWGAL
jgi:energy-coupling factor transport system permease protein